MFKITGLRIVTSRSPKEMFKTTNSPIVTSGTFSSRFRPARIPKSDASNHKIAYCASSVFQGDASTHPFTAPVVMPATKYFWSARNTTRTGIRDRQDAAMMRPYSAEYWEMNIFRPICSVFLFSDVR